MHSSPSTRASATRAQRARDGGRVAVACSLLFLQDPRRRLPEMWTTTKTTKYGVGKFLSQHARDSPAFPSSFPSAQRSSRPVKPARRKARALARANRDGRVLQLARFCVRWAFSLQPDRLKSERTFTPRDLARSPATCIRALAARCMCVRVRARLALLHSCIDRARE